MPHFKEKSFVDGCWDDEVLRRAPAWFIAVDDSERDIILSLRGTSKVIDLLTDLTAQFTKWSEGFAHRGFLKAMIHLERLIKDKILSLMTKHKDYSLVLCGHSMGAAVAALLSLFSLPFPLLSVFKQSCFSLPLSFLFFLSFLFLSLSIYFHPGPSSVLLD